MVAAPHTSFAPHFTIRVAARSETGRQREKNEDAFVVADLTGGAISYDLGASPTRLDVGERGVLLAVSDGMGGAAAGEVASALVVETLTRALSKAPASSPRDALMDVAIQRAHRAVWDAGKKGGAKMGATLTAAFLHAGEAYLAEVGDSRAYLVRAGEITQLTHDQSLVQTLLDRGALEPSEASDSPLKNIILQAMGNQPKLQVALAKLSLRDRDLLLLCSDGLSNFVTDLEIKDAVLRLGRPEAIVPYLVDLAVQRGGGDDITVVVAGVGGELPRPSEPVSSTLEILREFDAATKSSGEKSGD